MKFEFKKSRKFTEQLKGSTIVSFFLIGISLIGNGFMVFCMYIIDYLFPSEKIIGFPELFVFMFAGGLISILTLMAFVTFGKGEFHLIGYKNESLHKQRNVKDE